MAKIDISTIEGYESMTPEQKVSALEAFEFKPDTTGFVPKATFDKTASELASLKKKQSELLSEDERKKQEDAEKMAGLEQQVKDLTGQLTVNQYTAELLGLGYDKDLALATAKAMVDGDTKTVFANQKAFKEAQMKALRAEIMRDTPYPEGGAGSGVDYQKKISEALAEEDYATASYWTRVQQEANKAKP